jgi:hypothetical protein
MYHRDDEELHCRGGEQAEHFSASQGTELICFSAQNSLAEVEDSCRRAEDAPETWSRAEDVGDSGAEPRLQAALADLGGMQVLRTCELVTATVEVSARNSLLHRS